MSKRKKSVFILTLFVGLLPALWSNGNGIAAQTSSAQQQRKTITGVVKDSNGETLIGASVKIKGSSTGTITDIDGAFTLSGVPQGATLVISYVGMDSKEVAVDNASSLTVTLTEKTVGMNEVVVVGYGTMLKKDLTGSVTQIRPDKIAAESPKTVQDVLRGTAGIAITSDPSAKGGGNITIRGQRSVYTDGGHNNPLIVMDGMIFSGEMSEINPDDIGQIDILKDASAAAIYGAQAANGVLIITTKKGKLGKPVVSLSVNFGATSKSSYRNVWSPEQYLQSRVDFNKAPTYEINPTTGVYEAYQMTDSKGNLIVPNGYYDNPNNLANLGVDINTWRTTGSVVLTNGESDLSLWFKRLTTKLGDGSNTLYNNYIAGKTFDWYKHTFRTGFNKDYNASVSGASDRINYYLSFGYTQNEGAVTGDVFNNVRSNMKVSGKIFDWLEIGANVNFQKRTDAPYLPNLSPNNSDINLNQIRNSPYGTYRNDDGTLAQYPNGNGNFKGVNFDFNRQYVQSDAGYYVLNPVFNAKITFPFNIIYTFNALPRLQWYHNYYWESSQQPAWKASNNGLVDRDNHWWYNWSLNNQLAWEKTFAQKHRVSITLVQEAARSNDWDDVIHARNFQPSDVLGFHNTSNSTPDNTTWSTTDNQQSSASYLGRLFYSYDDRYMLTTSLRRDGYSAFGSSNPYATFPSVAVAWTFTNEKFFKFEPMNYGKLRITWGKNGNRGLGNPYQALANLTASGSNTYTYVNNTTGAFLTPSKYLMIDRMANPNLRWETSNQWNFGLDFGFLKNRITGSFEYYSTATDNMIMNEQLVPFAGFNTLTTNLGLVTNKGFEISLNTVNIKTNVVEWNTSVNFSYNQNKIVHLYYTYNDVKDADGNVIGRKETDDLANGWFIGQPIDEIWDFKQTGIWQAKDYDVAKKDYNQRPGDPIVWKNPNNPLQKDATTGYYNYDQVDKVYLGSRTPPVNWSMRNDVTFFKNLTLTFNMYSRLGAKATSTEYMNDDNASNALDQGANSYIHTYWTPENPSSQYARIGAIGPGGAPTPPKIFDKSFIRFDNLSLAYSLPQKWIQRFEIQKLQVVGSIRNLGVWCIGGWPYGDPETLGGAAYTANYGSTTDNNNGLRGLATRTFTVGVNVIF